MKALLLTSDEAALVRQLLEAVAHLPSSSSAKVTASRIITDLNNQEVQGPQPKKVWLLSQLHDDDTFDVISVHATEELAEARARKVNAQCEFDDESIDVNFRIECMVVNYVERA